MRRFLLPFSATACLPVGLPAPASEPPQFANEVMAVLSKAGCNQGACRGNLNGKGGFTLRLRGEDPERDFQAPPNSCIGKLLAAQKSNREVVTEFYLRELWRPPTARKLEATEALIDRSKDRRAGLEDVDWGLVNAKEFLLRR